MRGKLKYLKIWRPFTRAFTRSLIRPVARRWGRRGAILLLGIPVALIIGGGAYASLLLATGGSSINLQSGLIGWWKLDGNAYDSSPYGYNGTMSGPPTATADRNGQAGGALAFDSTVPDYISRSNYDNGVLRSGSFSASWTLSIWAKWSGTNTNEKVLLGRQGCNGGIYTWNNGYAFAIKGSGCWTGAQTIAYTPSNITDWHLLTATYSNGAMQFFVDGSSVGTATLSDMYNYGTALGIGSAGTSSYSFNGSLDDARIYNRVLSGAEISALYSEYHSQVNAASGENGLIGRWKMNGNAKDDTPYAHDGTINGSPTATTDREGNANGAYSFNGSTDYLQMPGASFFNVDAGQAKTYSIWFKGSTPAANENFYWEQGGCIGWQFSALTNGEIQFGLTTGNNTCTGYNSYTAQTTTSYTDNQWHLATAVVDRPGGNEYLYIDGVLKASHAVDNTYSGIGGTFRIGTNYNNTKAFAGSLADARVYSRALSQDDVSNLYNSYDSQINLYSSAGSTGSGADIASGLKGEWDFAGNAKDSTPYSDNGNVHSATLTSDRFGIANRAYSFDGSSAYILMNHNAAFDIGQPGLTVTAWINPTSFPGGDVAIVNRNAPYLLWLDTTNKRIYTGLYKGSTWYWASGATNDISTGTWQQVAMTYDGTSRKIYVNGAQSGSTDTQISGNIDINATSGLAVGYDYCCGGRFYFPGAIDDVRIYNRALSATDIQALYNLAE